MSFVLDASITVSWVFASETVSVSRRALDRVQATFASTPQLWQFEVASALRKMILDGRLSPMQAPGFLADLSTFDIRSESSRPPIQLLLDLGQQFGLSTYDAAYLELAMRTSQPLATLDQDLAKAALRAGVKLIG
jgi:predicted nucleic acid-binding protein